MVAADDKPLAIEAVHHGVPEIHKRRQDIPVVPAATAELVRTRWPTARDGQTAHRRSMRNRKGEGGGITAPSPLEVPPARSLADSRLKRLVAQCPNEGNLAHLEKLEDDGLCTPPRARLARAGLMIRPDA